MLRNSIFKENDIEKYLTPAYSSYFSTLNGNINHRLVTGTISLKNIDIMLQASFYKMAAGWQYVGFIDPTKTLHLSSIHSIQLQKKYANQPQTISIDLIENGDQWHCPDHLWGFATGQYHCVVIMVAQVCQLQTIARQIIETHKNKIVPLIYVVTQNEAIKHEIETIIKTISLNIAEVFADTPLFTAFKNENDYSYWNDFYLRLYEHLQPLYCIRRLVNEEKEAQGIKTLVNHH